MKHKLLPLLLISLGFLFGENGSEYATIGFKCSQNLKGNQTFKVLFVVSNAKYYGDSEIETTNNFPEIAYAYHEFIEAGITVDFISPRGGQVPVGYVYSSEEILQKYLFNELLMNKLKNTKTPHEINVHEYLAIYYVGGGSAMFEVPENTAIQEIARSIIEDNQGTLSAICHGTAGIVNIKNREGKFFINEKRITGFPDEFENRSARYYKQFPFSIDEAVKDRGGQFTYSKEGWDGYFISDGRILTGQDPTSAKAVAQGIIQNHFNTAK